MDAAGRAVTPADSTCQLDKPLGTAICLTQATITACKPSFLADWYFRGQDCYGHGLCGAAGCECKDGWHGQFCEIPAKCKGVMDRHNQYCSSGVLNVTGECCPTASVLDSSGACCVSGQVDACGSCDGTSWAIDVRVSRGIVCDDNSSAPGVLRKQIHHKCAATPA